VSLLQIDSTLVDLEDEPTTDRFNLYWSTNNHTKYNSKHLAG
jgi:hypothetical protein